MAFQRAEFARFYQLLKEARTADPETRGAVENFILEERLTNAREDSYGGYVANPMSLGDWQVEHENYLSQKINVYHGTLPETFGDANLPNALPALDEDQFLVRLEHLAWPCQLEGLAENEMVDKLSQFLKSPADRGVDAPFHFVESFLANWNRNRDARPIFVGFWAEVKDLFVDQDDNEIITHDWPNRLRDRFGLGHYDPEGKSPIPVLLLRYRVEEVINAQAEKTKYAAIPTVLDGKLSPFFCPTPAKGLHEGQSLNLTPGDPSDYFPNCEIIHRFIEYKPAHFYRVGWITESPGKTCEEARAIHYELLNNDFQHFDELRK